MVLWSHGGGYLIEVFAATTERLARVATMVVVIILSTFAAVSAEKYLSSSKSRNYVMSGL